MMAKGQKGTGKVDRKTIEKNRRMHMKGLCFKLASLIPRDATAATVPKEELTQLDSLDEATAYIKKLQARIEELSRRKEAVLATAAKGGYSNGDASSFQPELEQEQQQEQEPLPLVDVRVVDTVLEVVLVSPANSGKSFPFFYKVMASLEEEGAKVANASFSVVNDKMFCTIHAQVPSPAASVELVSVAVAERLRQLVC